MNSLTLTPLLFTIPSAMEIELAALSRPEVYQLMTRVVAPRPIAFVSTLGADGRGNLAPFSYFNIGGMNPPSCVFCPVRSRGGTEKDTLLNIRETGEYVISVVTFPMAERMNRSSFAFPRGVDEFDEVGFTRAPSMKVKPPRVAESPIHLECRLFQIVEHGAEAGGSAYIIGEILHIHLDDAVLTQGLPDPAKIDAIGRLGGDWYGRTGPDSLFALPRPPVVSPANPGSSAGPAK